MVVGSSFSIWFIVFNTLDYQGYRVAIDPGFNTNESQKSNMIIITNTMYLKSIKKMKNQPPHLVFARRPRVSN